MSRASVSPLTQNRSCPDGSCLDPYDRAEQGFQIDLADLSGTSQPLEARKILSFHSSLRTSDSTLVGLPAHDGIAHDPRRPSPRQGKL
jgi:hypothetical protein